MTVRAVVTRWSGIAMLSMSVLTGCGLFSATPSVGKTADTHANNNTTIPSAAAEHKPFTPLQFTATVQPELYGYGNPAQMATVVVPRSSLLIHGSTYTAPAAGGTAFPMIATASGIVWSQASGGKLSLFESLYRHDASNKPVSLSGQAVSMGVIPAKQAEWYKTARSDMILIVAQSNSSQQTIYAWLPSNRHLARLFAIPATAHPVFALSDLGIVCLYPAEHVPPSFVPMLDGILYHVTTGAHTAIHHLATPVRVLQSKTGEFTVVGDNAVYLIGSTTVLPLSPLPALKMNATAFASLPVSAFPTLYAPAVTVTEPMQLRVDWSTPSTLHYDVTGPFRLHVTETKSSSAASATDDPWAMLQHAFGVSTRLHQFTLATSAGPPITWIQGTRDGHAEWFASFVAQGLTYSSGPYPNPADTTADEGLARLQVTAMSFPPEPYGNGDVALAWDGNTYTTGSLAFSPTPGLNVVMTAEGLGVLRAATTFSLWNRSLSQTRTP